MTSHLKQLKDRYFEKELRLYDIKSKGDLINNIVDGLNKHLPEDISEVNSFSFNFDTSLPLLNTDFFIYYRGLETSEEYTQRLIQEQIDKDKKVVLLNKLASELDYKLIKNENL